MSASRINFKPSSADLQRQPSLPLNNTYTSLPLNTNTPKTPNSTTRTNIETSAVIQCVQRIESLEAVTRNLESIISKQSGEISTLLKSFDKLVAALSHTDVFDKKVTRWTSEEIKQLLSGEAFKEACINAVRSNLQMNNLRL
jgi:hypothetical protein